MKLLTLKKLLMIIFMPQFFFIYQTATAQNEDDLHYHVTKYMENNYYEEVHDACDVERIFNFKHEDILVELKPYHDAEDVNTLHTLQELKMRIADETEDRKLRQRMIEQFVEDCSSNYLLMRQLAIRYLLDCRAIDFSPKAKKEIKKLISYRASNPKFLLLAGVANLKKQTEKLIQVVEATASKAAKLNKLQYFYSDHWYAKLALARIGNPTFLKETIAEIKASQKQIYRGKKTLLEHLGYIRQIAAIKQLQAYLNDETKELKPFFEESQRYTLQALDVLTSILNDFPIDRRLNLKYYKREIETARKWLKNRRAFKVIK